MGGLGNYLFQISAAYFISIRDNKELVCDYSDNVVPHKPYSEYIENFFNKIKFTNGIGPHTPIGQSGFNYCEIPYVDGSDR